jgi:hypothetical protein
MQNQRKPKQISKVMVVKMKRGRPRKNGEKVEACSSTSVHRCIKN